MESVIGREGDGGKAGGGWKSGKNVFYIVLKNGGVGYRLLATFFLYSVAYFYRFILVAVPPIASNAAEDSLSALSEDIPTSAQDSTAKKQSDGGKNNGRINQAQTWEESCRVV